MSLETVTGLHLGGGVVGQTDLLVPVDVDVCIAVCEQQGVGVDVGFQRARHSLGANRPVGGVGDQQIDGAPRSGLGTAHQFATSIPALAVVAEIVVDGHEVDVACVFIASGE